MPQFTVYALDNPGSAPKRAEHGDAHRQRLRDSTTPPVQVVIAGPLLGPDDKPVGSLVLVEAETIAAVEAFVAADPYSINGVYGSVDIKPIRWTIGDAPKA